MSQFRNFLCVTQNHQKGAKQKQRDVGCFIFFLTAPGKGEANFTGK